MCGDVFTVHRGREVLRRSRNFQESPRGVLYLFLFALDTAVLVVWAVGRCSKCSQRFNPLRSGVVGVKCDGDIAWQSVFFTHGPMLIATQRRRLHLRLLFFLGRLDDCRFALWLSPLLPVLFAHLFTFFSMCLMNCAVIASQSNCASAKDRAASDFS